MALQNYMDEERWVKFLAQKYAFHKLKGNFIDELYVLYICKHLEVYKLAYVGGVS